MSKQRPDYPRGESDFRGCDPEYSGGPKRFKESFDFQGGNAEYSSSTQDRDFYGRHNFPSYQSYAYDADFQRDAESQQGQRQGTEFQQGHRQGTGFHQGQDYSQDVKLENDQDFAQDVEPANDQDLTQDAELCQDLDSSKDVEPCKDQEEMDVKGSEDQAGPSHFQAAAAASPATLDSDAPSWNLHTFTVQQISYEQKLVEGCWNEHRSSYSAKEKDEKSSVQLSPKGKAVTNHIVKKALRYFMTLCKKTIIACEGKQIGRAHQQFPKELLLDEEADQLYSVEGIYLMLSAGMGKLSHHRLVRMKAILEAAQKYGCGTRQKDVDDIHHERHTLMKSFTSHKKDEANRNLKAQLNHLQKCFNFFTVSQKHLEEALGKDTVAKLKFYKASFQAVQHEINIVERELGTTSKS